MLTPVCGAISFQLLLRLPLPRQSLGFGYLGGGHFGGYIFPELLRHHHTVTRRKGKPLVCLHVILRHTIPLAVHQAEVVLGIGVTLFGGPAVPPQSLRMVLRHALA